MRKTKKNASKIHKEETKTIMGWEMDDQFMVELEIFHSLLDYLDTQVKVEPFNLDNNQVLHAFLAAKKFYELKTEAESKVMSVDGMTRQ